MNQPWVYMCSPSRSPLFLPILIGLFIYNSGLPGDPVVKNPAANAGDVGSVPGLGRSSGEGNGNPLQYSCLENPMDRGAWQAEAH